MPPDVCFFQLRGARGQSLAFHGRTSSAVVLVVSLWLSVGELRVLWASENFAKKVECYIFRDFVDISMCRKTLETAHIEEGSGRVFRFSGCGRIVTRLLHRKKTGRKFSESPELRPLVASTALDYGVSGDGPPQHSENAHGLSTVGVNSPRFPRSRASFFSR